MSEGAGSTDQPLLSWAAEQLAGGDDEARAAISRVLCEILIFYLLVAIGFGALWVTWRSSARVQQLKKSAVAVLREQRTAKFEPQDGAKMYGYF